jgi:hypothetical protein
MISADNLTLVSRPRPGNQKAKKQKPSSTTPIFYRVAGVLCRRLPAESQNNYEPTQRPLEIVRGMAGFRAAKTKVIKNQV